MLEAPIERVLVGRSYAEVTRSVVITRGENGFSRSIEITGLTLALDDASVRIRSCTVGVAVRALHVRLAVEERGQSEASDETRVREAEREVLVLKRMLDGKRRTLARVQATNVHPRPDGTKKDGPPSAPAEARLALVGLVRDQSERLAREVIDDEHHLVEAERALHAALDAFRRASNDRPLRADELSKAVVVDVEESTDAPDLVRLELSYVVPGARWMPEYTLRIEGVHARLELRAVVQQRTGEDWKGVRLSLSTASREQRGEVPELASLRIGRAQRSQQKRGFRAAPVGASELYADYDRALASFVPPATAAITDAPVVEPSPSPMPYGAPGGYGPPPPPASASALAASMPFPMDAPQSFGSAVPRSALVMATSEGRPKSGGLLANVLGAGPRQRSAGPMGGGAAQERARSDHGTYATQSASEIELRVDVSTLSYGRLRMGAPDGPARGELQSLSDARLYVEASASVRLITAIDLSAIVTSAANEAQALPPPPPRHRVAEEHDGFASVFEADAAIDVPSDGQGHAIALHTASAPITLYHVAVPRETRDAFRCAEVQNPLDAPLLAGPLDVYEGNDFLLSTELRTTAPRGWIKLGLGVDPAVKIARNVEFGETVTGLMRGSLDLRHVVVVDVSNQRADALRIDVRERIPTVRDNEGDIKVETTSVSPAWEDYEEDDHKIGGGHVWRLTVPTGEKRRLALEYVVRISAKHELVGGNRRES